MVCVFNEWHARLAGDWLERLRTQRPWTPAVFWLYAYLTRTCILNWEEFAPICKMQAKKHSSWVALWGQPRLRFACLVVQLIKQLANFQDSLTPALSFIFLCHYFLREKGLISMKLWGGKPVLYIKEKHFYFSYMKCMWKYSSKFSLCNLLRLRC